MLLVITLLIAYLLGSIPFGLLLTKAAGMGDIRNVGSGNIGATNVLRTGNKKLALLTLLLDGAKGWLAIYIISYVIPQNEVPTNQYHILLTYLASLTCPVAVVIGHVFPVWLKFKGGKGVATAFGAALGVSLLIGAIGLACWLGMFAAKRISSLSALLGINIMPLAALITGNTIYFIPLTLIAVLVTYRHKDNIRRLLAGTEPKFGSKK